MSQPQTGSRKICWWKTDANWRHNTLSETKTVSDGSFWVKFLLVFWWIDITRDYIQSTDLRRIYLSPDYPLRITAGFSKGLKISMNDSSYFKKTALFWTRNVFLFQQVPHATLLLVGSSPGSWSGQSKLCWDHSWSLKSYETSCAIRMVWRRSRQINYILSP